jgi:hypothetical protein
MKRIAQALFVCTIVLAAAEARAVVNCDQVRKYLATGRTPEQIAESMIIDVEEVKKCQQAAPAAAATPKAEEAK